MSGILNAFSGGSYGSPPANTVAPAVTGTATFGQTLSSTTGTWTGVPTPTFTYQWYRSPSTAITSATSSTYVLVAADVGNTIYCAVTATNAISSVSANSNTTATVAATVPGAPTIGTATTVNCSSATVAFTAPSCTGGASITGYQAACVATGTKTGTGASSPITVSGLSPSTSYTFKVRAQNSIGYGSYSGNSNSITTSAPPYMCVSASGASITTCGSYKYARFIGSGSFTVNSVGACGTYGNKIWYLVVAGGGYGADGSGTGATGGGGGAGGFLSNCGYTQTVSARGYTVTVGSSTFNSSIACIATATAGGRGANQFGPASIGGSGGGGGGTFTAYTGPAAGTSGQGNSGGAGSFTGGGKCGNYAAVGGGGGGASGVGGNGITYSMFSGGGGYGGAGRASCITGSSVGYAGGAGGGGYAASPVGTIGASGGSGGGAGASGANGYAPTAGTAYTGGGGGGSANTSAIGQPGGSGIVVVRWKFQ